MKKFEKIVIASDLDGTFFGKGGSLVDRNLEAVKYFTDNGGHFTVSTGRVPMHVVSAFPNVAEYVNMKSVACNGACIHDFRSDETLKIYTVPYEDIKAIVDFIHSEYADAAIRSSSIEYGFMCTPKDIENKFVAHDYEVNASMHKLIAPIEEWSETELFKVVVRAEPELATEIFKEIKKRFSGTLSVTQSGRSILDVQKGGRDKGVALRELTDELGEGYRLYTCGDYINDLEMHAAADVSVCPSNAHPEVLKVCKLCLGTNYDGLIADLVEYLDRTEE